MIRVLKDQPLTFLHVFHHSAVVVMAWLVRPSCTHSPLVLRLVRASGQPSPSRSRFPLASVAG